MSRIVFTVAIGDPTQARAALGLGRSLKLLGDGTPRAVVTDADLPWDRCFHRILPPTAGAEQLLLSEGFAQVLSLSPELLAFKRLGPLFDSLSGLGRHSEAELQYWEAPTIASGDRGGVPREAIGTAREIVGGLELDVRDNRCRWVERSPDGAILVEPMLFRAACSVASAAYRRQLEELERLDRYEQTHGFGYASPLHKLQRSIEKRILKLQKRL
jgi:hypothetical protein